MPMKPLSDFLPRLMPLVIGCPEPLATQALLDTAIKFCEDSLVIRQRLADFPTVQGQRTYALTAPTDQLISRVLRVWVNDTLIFPVPQNDASELSVGQRSPVAYYTSRSDSVFTLLLDPIPDKVYTIGVDVALRPTRTATQVQDDLFDFWMEPLIAGASGSLRLIPDQPFSDPALAASSLTSFAFWSRKARAESQLGRIRASSTVRANPFA